MLNSHCSYRCTAIVVAIFATTIDATSPLPPPKPLKPSSGLAAVDVFWRGELADNGIVYP